MEENKGNTYQKKKMHHPQFESILITATVEAMEEREVAVIDQPGTFVHAKNEREVLVKME